VGREADNSCPSIAKVKNMWSYTSTPPYFSTTWCLIKPGEGFFSYLTGCNVLATMETIVIAAVKRRSRYIKCNLNTEEGRRLTSC
jgi:hypothetical protein